MVKKTNDDAPEEDLTPYPTQAQNDAAKLAGGLPPAKAEKSEEDEADAKEKAAPEPKDRQVKAEGGAEYKTR